MWCMHCKCKNACCTCERLLFCLLQAEMMWSLSTFMQTGTHLNFVFIISVDCCGILYSSFCSSFNEVFIIVLYLGKKSTNVPQSFERDNMYIWSWSVPRKRCTSKKRLVYTALSLNSVYSLNRHFYSQN